MSHQSKQAGKRRRVLMALTAAALEVSVGGLAVARLVPMPAADADAASAGDPQGGVYVKDSAIAADKFELGKRMERLKEWHKSADVYQEILEKYKDRVVPIQLDDKQRPVKYASVREAVRARLARWPQEGLTVYRNRFEPAAAMMLESAGSDDLARLHEAYDLYFVTDAGKQAGMRLIELYLENGEFTHAGWISDRLLGWHPNLVAERPAVLFRSGVAYHLAGNPNEARKRLDELTQKFPEEAGTIAGKDQKLVDALAAQLKMPSAVAAGGTGESYPMFGGGISRTALSAAAARPYVRVAKLDTPGPVVAGSDAIRNAVNAQWENARNLNLTINIIPAVDKGEMFYHDGYRVWAVHVETGLPIPGWLQSYPQQNRLGQYVAGGGVVTNLGDQALATQVMSPRQHTTTLTEDAVLAVMGVPDMRNFGGQAGGDSGTKLVCLERATGKPRWTVSASAVPNNAGNVRNLNFSGSPLVVGENVYVIARGMTGAGVEDCHVFCYELDSGRFKWQCYIASAQLGGGGGNPNMGMANAAGGVVPGSETLSHLAFASGRVFVVTNLGAVAAVDAYSGATAWLTIYPRDQVVADRRARAMGGAWMGGFQGGGAGTSADAPKPWEFNPVMVSDGKVFVLPTDGHYLTVYDATNGEEIRRIPRQFEYGIYKPKLDVLVGIDGERMFVAGGNPNSNSDEAIFCLDWTKAATVKGSRALTDESVLNVFPSVGQVRGRPFLTSKRLYMPTEAALFVIPVEDIGKAKVKQRYPKEGQWPAGDEGPGNVVASGEHVIVANARNVSIYTDLDAVRARLAEQIKADPANVGPRLSFAEQVFNAREFEEAVRMLDEAIQVMGGLKDRQGPERERVFRNAIIFAGRLGDERPRPDKDYGALADRLYETAAQAAVTASEQVTYRTTRAKSIENSRAAGPDYARAVALYQEILDSPDMRLVMMAGADAASSMQAGKASELAIKALISKHGASVYSAFEDAAAAQLKELSEKGKPDALLALAERYPNASTASAALMKAAEFYEKSGNPRMATQVLRRLYWKYAERYAGPQRAQLAEAMARNYLKAGNFATAQGRLQKAASVSPDAALTGDLFLPDGKPLLDADGKPVRTLKDAAEAMERLSDQRSSASLADIRVPPPPIITKEQRLELLMKGEQMPVNIPFEPRPDPAAAAVAGVQRVLEAPEEISEFVRHDRVLAATGGDVTCLKPGDAAPAWKSDALGEPANAAAWLDRSRVLVWGEGSIALLDGDADGTMKWKAELRNLSGVDLVAGGGAGDQGAAPAAGNPAVAQLDDNPPQIIQARRVVVGPRVIGGNIAVAPPVEAAPDQQLNPNDGRERILHVRPLTDRLIATTTSGRVLAIDLKDGRILWQTRLAHAATILQTEATDDFAAVRLTEGGVAQLVVLDAFNGQLTFRRSFNMQSGNYVINFALATDGTLVWTMPGSLVGKDLYEPNDAPWERPGRNFGGMTSGRQLRIHNQTVLAVCDGGKTVDRRSLRSGNTVGNPLQTFSAGPNVALHVAGPRLYVAGSNSLIVYHLEQDTSIKFFGTLQYDPAAVRVTRDFTIVPGVVEEREDQGKYMLGLYSRYLIKSESTGKQAESGLRNYDVPVTTTAKVRSWHAVEGGIYYLTGDEKLHFLRGTRK